jgi:hypothetical protein
MYVCMCVFGKIRNKGKACYWETLLKICRKGTSASVRISGLDSVQRYLINGRIFGKKVIYYTKCFDFVYKFCPKYFPV